MMANIKGLSTVYFVGKRSHGLWTVVCKMASQITLYITLLIRVRFTFYISLCVFYYSLHYE